MYKIFFVDDEIIIREGFRTCIQWEETPYTLVGEAPDGEIAIEKIQELKPDIIITDIKMPFLDGIELSRIVKKIMPWVHIIILSGHDEFTYAKEAISIGIDEYILKPFSANDVIEALRKVAIKIEEEKNQAFDVANLRQQIKSQENIIKENLLSSSLHNEKMENTSTEDLAILQNESMLDNLKYILNSDIDTVIEQYATLLGNNPLQLSIVGSYLLVDIIVASTKIIEELGGEVKNVYPCMTSHEYVANAITSVDTFVKELRTLLKAVISFRDSFSTSRYSDIILKAKKYIEMHYANNTISLKTVASHVHMSPNHFSSIFSQESNMSFIEYVTSVRIEHAKQKLIATQLRASDIAYAVGFSDPHYFSATFKKNTGFTPSEYREKENN